MCSNTISSGKHCLDAQQTADMNGGESSLSLALWLLVILMLSEIACGRLGGHASYQGLASIILAHPTVEAIPPGSRLLAPS